jgi:hypothetical protein
VAKPMLEASLAGSTEHCGWVAAHDSSHSEAAGGMAGLSAVAPSELDVESSPSASVMIAW